MYRNIAVVLSVALLGCGIHTEGRAAIFDDEIHEATVSEADISEDLAKSISENAFHIQCMDAQEDRETNLAGFISFNQVDEEASLLSENEIGKNTISEGSSHIIYNVDDEKNDEENDSQTEQQDLEISKEISDNDIIFEDESISDNQMNEQEVGNEGTNGTSFNSVSVNVDTEGELHALSENDVKKGISVSEGNAEKKAEEQVISKISMPSKVEICFNPLNLCGKEDVYSEHYEVVNYGNRDIAIKMKEIDVSYKGRDSLYELSDEPVYDTDSKKKRMNINMVWENKHEGLKKVLNVVDKQTDEYVIYLKAAQYDKNGNFVKLNKGSKGIFYFKGSLNTNPDIEWVNGEISVDYRYEVVNGEDNGIQEEFSEFIGANPNSQATID